MEVKLINNHLAVGNIHAEGMLPHLENLKRSPYIFNIDFGLKKLPTEPGILIIRGARQYGKSSWLEGALYQTVEEFGPGSAFYLNGEYLLEVDLLEKSMLQLIALFPKKSQIKRIFIDEITAIKQWELGLKRLSDQGLLNDILVITTGSKATDLRRGTEKLPGRKGKLTRTNYLFTPISYQEFHRVCAPVLKEKTLLNYLISGGSPIACSALMECGTIPEYVIELTRDWVEGEITATRRSKLALHNIMNSLFRWGGSPVGQAKIARESDLANNTIAAGYIEILNDLGCVIPSYAWDQHKKQLILRKPCKYHITNLLVAIAYHSARIRNVDDFLQLSHADQGMWYEWLVAQELTRRTAIFEDKILEPLAFWQNKQHEIDFIHSSNQFIEVKKGQVLPLEFAWFAHQFPGKHLTTISTSTFETGFMKSITMENFLLEQ